MSNPDKEEVVPLSKFTRVRLVRYGDEMQLIREAFVSADGGYPEWMMSSPIKFPNGKALGEAILKMWEEA